MSPAELQALLTAAAAAVPSGHNYDPATWTDYVTLVPDIARAIAPILAAYERCNIPPNPQSRR